MELKLTKEQVLALQQYGSLTTVEINPNKAPQKIRVVDIISDWLALRAFKENVERAMEEIVKEKLRRYGFENEEQLAVGIGISVANDILQKAVKE